MRRSCCTKHWKSHACQINHAYLINPACRTSPASWSTPNPCSTRARRTRRASRRKSPIVWAGPDPTPPPCTHGTATRPIPTAAPRRWGRSRTPPSRRTSCTSARDVKRTSRPFTSLRLAGPTTRLGWDCSPRRGRATDRCNW